MPLLAGGSQVHATAECQCNHRVPISVTIGVVGGPPSSNNAATPRELITLAPGGYAHADLQITNAANFPASACTQVKSDWLAVIPPNQTAPLYVSFSSTACRGTAKLLTVTAVRSGTS